MIDVEQLRSKILDLAISGKLVPQDPNDEPASVLLERIQKEKEALVKTGKIKKADPPSIIYKGSDNRYYEKTHGIIRDVTDQLPYEIPASWAWVRLRDLGLFKKGPFGSSITKETFVPNTYPNRIKVYEQKNAIKKDWTLGKYFITPEKFKELSGFEVDGGDIIVSCAGTIGEIYTLPSEAEKGVINQALMRIKLYDASLQEYFLCYFDFVLKREASNKGSGTGMKNIPPFDVLKQMLVPLPSDKSYYGQPRRFTALGTLISGRDLIPSQYSNEKRGIPYITGASNFENGSIIVNRWTDQPAVIAKKGDVLITCKGTIGKTAVLQLEECHIARQIMAFRCNKGTLFPKYLQYYFAFLERDLANSSSSLIPGFKREELTKKLVSFPDYKTQIEVAQKIDLLFRRIDSFNDGSSAQ
jgi:restriction endonuclease S subunit